MESIWIAFYDFRDFPSHPRIAARWLTSYILCVQTFKVRWRNFHGFDDTGDLEIRPITVLLGANNCGKSSLFLPLLLMQQTVEADHEDPTLVSRGSSLNAGGFCDLAHRGDSDAEIGLELEFRREEPGNDCGDPFHYPPGRLSTRFKRDRDTDLAKLTDFRLSNSIGEPMLRRRLLDSGRYSLEGMAFGSEPAKSEFDKLLRREFRRATPRGFIFPTMGATIAASLEMPHGDTRETARPVSLYWQALDFLSFNLLRFFEKLGYLGPLRAPPQRVYEISGSRPESVGSTGERAPEVLYHADDEQRAQIQDWLARFSFEEALETIDLGEGAFSIHMTPPGTTHEVNYADMGFGLSQVLPLIVESVACSPSNLLVTEQPEIHLNPKLQMILAELIALRSREGGFTIVETHSEHLLLRLRRLIATDEIDATDVALYYVERTGDRSTVREVPIERNGHISEVAWPAEFFGEALDESIELALAQVRV